MAAASVKITASAADYRAQMKSCAAATKELTSQYTAAKASADLFGRAADALKAKAESLTGKIEVQKKTVELTKAEHDRLTDKLNAQKARHEELAKKVEEAREALEKSKTATGENSEESKAGRRTCDAGRPI